MPVCNISLIVMSIRIILVAVIMFTSITGRADSGPELHLLDPTEVSTDLYHYATNHDPYMAPLDTQLKQGANFNLNVDLAEYSGYRLYMQNILHFDQEGQTGVVKHAGWQYELGTTLFQYEGRDLLEGFLQHHSQHILDDDRPDQHFPVYTRYGIRLIFLRK